MSKEVSKCPKTFVNNCSFTAEKDGHRPIKENISLSSVQFVMQINIWSNFELMRNGNPSYLVPKVRGIDNTQRNQAYYYSLKISNRVIVKTIHVKHVCVTSVTKFDKNLFI